MSSSDSDQFSDMTDSDADKKRRGLRRGQRQQVNYRETSESSDNSRASAKRDKVKSRGRPRKEHFSSDFSDGESPLESAASFHFSFMQEDKNISEKSKYKLEAVVFYVLLSLVNN